MFDKLKDLARKIDKSDCLSKRETVGLLLISKSYRKDTKLQMNKIVLNILKWAYCM